MAKFTVIPQNTFSQIQMDVGVLLYNFDPTAADPTPADADIICATTGGIQASCTPTYSNFAEDIDNLNGEYKEFKHLDGWACELSTTAVSISPEMVRMALGAADVDETNTAKIIPRRDLQQSDFRDIWWVGDKIDGGWVAVKIKNALATSGFSIQTTKNGKGQFAFTIAGHMSLQEQSVVPMEFYVVDAEAESTELTTTEPGSTTTEPGSTTTEPGSTTP